VSHIPLREESDCLNCGAIIHGRYCHVCGQENTVRHESFWHMAKHFFYDITHFDGSFFTTLKDLLFKPGFLSTEYMLGRRKKYLHPIRMYVFTSAVFFLVFFSLVHVSEKDITGSSDKLEENIRLIKKDALKEAKTAEDSAKVFKGLELLGLDEKKTQETTDTVLKAKPLPKGNMNFTISKDVKDYTSVEEYDSLQATLPKAKRDNGLSRAIMRKMVALNIKYEGDQRKILAEFINTFTHSIPYLLFVSLPLFALYLRWLHWRRRKEFYFADHGVFLIHLYIFTFLFFLLYFGLDKLEDKTQWRPIGIVQGVLMLGGVIYTIIAMRNFYKQGWGKTILKFILFNILCTISILVLFTIFMAFSFYKI